MRKLLALLLLLPVLAHAQFWRDPSAVSGNGSFITPLTGGDGSVSATTYGFTSQPNTGMYHRSANTVTFSSNGTGAFEIAGGANPAVSVISTGTICFLSGAITTSCDTTLARDAADTWAQKRGTNPQFNRLYFSTTGPIYWMGSARTAGVLYTAIGGAAQVSYAQPAVPTITVNGGTSPVCVGTDTAMTCTEGTAPPAAATFTVTFSGTWPAAPSCVAMRATTGVTPLVSGLVTSTTTVVVNLSANLVASEKYNILCFGIS